MFGWEVGNLHNIIYNNLEWHARLNIGINKYLNNNYNFKASRNCTRCNGEYVCLQSEMLSNGFCEIFSNAGEQGYERAYDVIQKWCN